MWPIGKVCRSADYACLYWVLSSGDVRIRVLVPEGYACRIRADML